MTRALIRARENAESRAGGQRGAVRGDLLRVVGRHGDQRDLTARSSARTARSPTSSTTAAAGWPPSGSRRSSTRRTRSTCGCATRCCWRRTRCRSASSAGSLRADGEEALVFLSASVLRDPDGTPRYYVTSAEDVSDKHFLEDQLQFQAIHDALTGLVNRQRFLGLLEESLRGKQRVDGLTVFHLDLDGFRAINNGMGREAGDRLLQSVATKLRQVFDDEKATIARFDGDEFGVLLVNTLTTPSIGSIAARINEELAEPVYLGCGERASPPPRPSPSRTARRRTPCRRTCCAPPTPRCSGSRPPAGASGAWSTWTRTSRTRPAFALAALDARRVGERRDRHRVPAAGVGAGPEHRRGAGAAALGPRRRRARSTTRAAWTCWPTPGCRCRSAGGCSAARAASCAVDRAVRRRAAEAVRRAVPRSWPATRTWCRPCARCSPTPRSTRTSCSWACRCRRCA